VSRSTAIQHQEVGNSATLLPSSATCLLLPIRSRRWSRPMIASRRCFHRCNRQVRRPRKPRFESTCIFPDVRASGQLPLSRLPAVQIARSLRCACRSVNDQAGSACDCLPADATPFVRDLQVRTTDLWSSLANSNGVILESTSLEPRHFSTLFDTFRRFWTEESHCCQLVSA
jgi:hypothetical protein